MSAQNEGRVSRLCLEQLREALSEGERGIPGLSRERGSAALGRNANACKEKTEGNVNDGS